jgi:cytochrome P450
MANAYAITHDESVYKDPDTFNPDRYLSVDEGGAGEPLPVGHFGFGRRSIFLSRPSRTLSF